MVLEQMETSGFVRPTLFLVGTKSRFGYTFTSMPEDMNEAANAMPDLGKQLAAEHPEVGPLVRAYLAVTAVLTSRSDTLEPREVLLIHGVDTATNKQEAIVFTVLRDKIRFMQSYYLKELPIPQGNTIPEHPILQALVYGYTKGF